MLEADEFGWCPLHYASHFGHVKFVEQILEKNISLAYIKDREGMSALHISAKKGHVDVIKTFIAKCPETCELLDNRARTALHIAAESGQVNAVKIFLETLAFQDLINEQDNDGNTPFHLAAIKGHSKLLMMLADDSRIAWMAMDNAGMSTVDIIQSDIQLQFEDKVSTINLK
uniref:Uncharacterized protein n=1 Tax=Fagus sylvatica TaxID=28930 RepID=A0A2N9F4A0_FAGSY